MSAHHPGRPTSAPARRFALRRTARTAPNGRRNSTIALALGVCLCAGQLVGPGQTSALAEPAAPAGVVEAVQTVEAVEPAAIVEAVAETPILNKADAAADAEEGTDVSEDAIDVVPAFPETGEAGTDTVFRFDTGELDTDLGAGAAGEEEEVDAGDDVEFDTVASSKAAKIIAEAKKHKGKKYKRGGSGPKSFDCSGFTKYVFKKAVGKNLPHKANSQQKYGKKIAKSKAKPGDLIFFRSGSYAYHVGIYAGGGYMYDSPKPGKTVGKHKIWTRNYVVRRLV